MESSIVVLRQTILGQRLNDVVCSFFVFASFRVALCALSRHLNQINRILRLGSPCRYRQDLGTYLRQISGHPHRTLILHCSDLLLLQYR